MTLSYPGKLIVFEGIEGSGKTTQIQRLKIWLERVQDAPLVVTREPGGTALGKQLRSLLLSELELTPSNRAEMLLYAADRAQHVEEVLQPQLAAGAIILCDRYTDSTIAYQGYGRGLDIQLIEQLNAIATGGLSADLTLWLDVAVEVGQSRVRQRGNLDRMERSALEFHQRVREGYAAIAAGSSDRFIPIDASSAIERVEQQIQTCLSQRLLNR